MVSVCPTVSHAVRTKMGRDFFWQISQAIQGKKCANQEQSWKQEGR
jgi:hypothetical protein